MSVNAMTEEYEHIELFGKPALFTNARVDTHTVPDGWHVYDLRGSDNDPGSPCTLEILVVVNHAGSIVVPEPISFPDNQDYREIGDALDFLGDEITLTEFCKQYGLKTPPKYKLRPASREEAGLFYSQVEEERDLQAGTVGHVRMDFGSSGKGFHHSWWPHNEDQFNTGEFKDDLQEVVDTLRADGPLKDLASMRAYENHGIDSRYTGPHRVAPTMSARYGTGGNNVPLVEQEPVFCITGNAIDRQPKNGGNGIGYQQDIAYTLTATDHHAVFSRQRVDVFKDGEVVSTQSARQHKDATDLVLQGTGRPKLIRRLTPLECERLQGFPDNWTAIPGASDSARYKALGNSVAIPCVDYVLHGISLVLLAS